MCFEQRYIEGNKVKGIELNFTKVGKNSKQ
jgi:hypothetical protein